VSEPVFYLTTPIYYINARPHLGHAYTTIVADAMARYRRLAGDRVWLLTGTDEHGEKIAQAAARDGLSPQALADANSAAFRDTWVRLGITNDDFIRTTEPRHARIVQQILQQLWEAGEIYFGKYGGHYCYGCERFYTEKEIADGKCPDHDTPLAWIEEENYFFRMSAYQQWLIEYIGAHPDLIRPERYRNEILGFLREPLQDLSISRPRARLQWGIPLPFDDRFVTYVWFDALINYLSALGEIGGEQHAAFWPHVQHLIGKDILKPHGVYWPCMLKAAGLPVYTHLNVHGFWRMGGGKMSKSIGNVVEALALTDAYGHDAFRYFVMREAVFGLDADFSEEALVGRLNADLANDLGNLVARATTLLAGRGAVPARGEVTPADGEVAAAYRAMRVALDAAMEEFAFSRALAAIWGWLSLLNRYVDAEQPWTLAKDEARRPRLDTVLYTLGESLRCLGIVLDPFLPLAAGKIREALGLRGVPTLADAEWGGLEPGATVRKLSGLFPRVVKNTGDFPAPAGPPPAVAAEASTASAGILTSPAAARPLAGAQPEAAGPLERITIADFARVDLRVAEVVSAAAMPKSKKLLRLTISLGAETRTVLAGIAEHYAPSDLVGRKVVVVANLQPAKLMGVESNGMVLAGSSDGGLALLTLDRDLPPGARVK
jgi:methionyl-tRNA synthetase